VARLPSTTLTSSPQKIKEERSYNKTKTTKKQKEYYTHLITFQEIVLFFRAEKADDVMLSLSEIKLLALDIENELYDFFKETGHKYKAKYRSLIFNIKDSKNKVSQNLVSSLQQCADIFVQSCIVSKLKGPKINFNLDRCLPFCPFSFGCCLVCPSLIYRFWLSLWYLQKFWVFALTGII